MPRNPKTALSRIWQKRGLTGAEVASSCGITETYLYEIARGAKNPSMDVAAALSELLQAPVEDLFPFAFSKRKAELLRNEQAAATG